MQQRKERKAEHHAFTKVVKIVLVPRRELIEPDEQVPPDIAREQRESCREYVEELGTIVDHRNYQLPWITELPREGRAISEHHG